METITDQNQAHRDSLVWHKVSKSEYMRTDGVTLRKNSQNARWYAFNEDGSKMMDSFCFQQVSGHSLTWAKLNVEHDA